MRSKISTSTSVSGAARSLATHRASRATASAKGELKGLDIDPSIFSPDDKEVAEDLILAAIKDAQSRASERAQAEMQKLTEAMGLPADMKLPF